MIKHVSVKNNDFAVLVLFSLFLFLFLIRLLTPKEIYVNRLLIFFSCSSPFICYRKGWFQHKYCSKAKTGKETAIKVHS